MSGFLDWVALSEKQVNILEKALRSADVKDLLAEYMKVPFTDASKRQIYVDFLFYNYAYVI